MRHEVARKDVRGVTCVLLKSGPYGWIILSRGTVVRPSVRMFFKSARKEYRDLA